MRLGFFNGGKLLTTATFPKNGRVEDVFFTFLKQD